MKKTRILESVPAPGKIVKYVDSFTTYAPSDLDYTYFSWTRALFSNYQVFHVHWPEFLLRDKTAMRRKIRRVLYAILILRLKCLGTPVVRTMHNMQPHSPGSDAEMRVLQKLDHLTERYVILSTGTQTPRPEITVVIPHGDFRDVFKSMPSSRKVPNRVLLFGRIEPYKGVIEFIRASEEIRTDNVEFRIVGGADAHMIAEIEAAIGARDSHRVAVTTRFETVSDSEMVSEITRASLVILPYTDSGNGNSGVAMVALSLNRPVLVYENPIMAELAREVGSEWVQMMAEPVNGPQIDRALQYLDALNLTEPEFVGRDWHSIANSYAQLFREVTNQ